MSILWRWAELVTSPLLLKRLSTPPPSPSLSPAFNSAGSSSRKKKKHPRRMLFHFVDTPEELWNQMETYILRSHQLIQEYGMVDFAQRIVGQSAT